MATIRGTSNADTLSGGNSADAVYGLGGGDKLSGGGGNDLLYGGDSADRLYGGGGSDRLHGQAGNDQIDAGGGSQAIGDHADGGSGTDTLKVDFTGTTAALNFTAHAGSSTVYKLGSLSYRSIEAFQVSGGSGHDTMVGASGNDVLSGGGGNDKLYGGDGNDEVRAGSGVDYLSGGGGDDTITFEHHYFSAGDAAVGGSGSDTLVIGNLLSNTFRVAATGTTTLSNGAKFSGFENFNVSIAISEAGSDIKTLGGNDTIDAWFDDKIDSGAGDDLVLAWHGSDAIQLGSGNDYVSVRYDGSDVVDGGSGTDTLEIDAGVDYSGYHGVTFAALGDLRLSVAAGHAELSGGSATAHYRNFEIIRFTGGGGNDSITATGATKLDVDAGAGNDTLRGGTGVDHLDGGAGSDTMSGGGGTDELRGDGGNDTIKWTSGDAWGGSGTDRVIVDWSGRAAGATIAFNANGFTYLDGDYGFGEMESMQFIGGSGNDRVTGSVGADHLNGGAGNDRLSGGTGTDTLLGGGSADELRGGAGADTFAYTHLYASIDTITDFSSAEDSFRFSRSALDVSASYTTRLTIGASAAGSSAQFVFDPVSHQLKWDADGSGGDDAQVIATLTGVSTLTAGDFILA